MFQRFSLTILTFYLVTVVLLVSGTYYVVVNEEANTFFIVLILGVLIALNGYMIAKMAVDPLKEHFSHLERFSKETLHELNLPISTITANTKMLQKNVGDDPKALKRIERIEAAAIMLQSRYDELAYLIAKQMHREVIEEFDLSDLLEERYAFLAPLYPQMRFDITLESTRVKMDRMGLRKVIDNLIDNAIKYSNGKGVVAIRLENSELMIEDYGVGMDEMQLLRIFDHYYQSDATMPGYGIGLGLVKSFCDKHKIALHVRSKPDVGTTMLLNFSKVI